MKNFMSLFMANLIVLLGVFLSNVIEHFEQNYSIMERLFFWFTMLSPFTFGFIFLFIFLENIILKSKNIKKWITIETLLLLAILIFTSDINTFLKYWYYTVALLTTQYIKYKILLNIQNKEKDNEK